MQTTETAPLEESALTPAERRRMTLRAVVASATGTTIEWAALIATLMLIVATMAIGFVPDYERIGILGAVLLVVFRVLQGIAVGGEWSMAVAAYLSLCAVVSLVCVWYLKDHSGALDHA